MAGPKAEDRGWAPHCLPSITPAETAPRDSAKPDFLRKTAPLSVKPNATSLPPVTEKGLAATLKELAVMLGWEFFHVYDSRRPAAGWPDVALVRPPRMILAELKRDGQKPTPAQEKWLELLKRVPGIEVFCWRPADWDTIVNVLA